VAWPPTIHFGEHVCACGSQQLPQRVSIRGLWLLVCEQCQNFVLYERQPAR
jgi:hypothetical protein